MPSMPWTSTAPLDRDRTYLVMATRSKLASRRLFRGTNTKLAPAVHLYDEVFRRIDADQLPVANYYARADVLMALRLDDQMGT